MKKLLSLTLSLVMVCGLLAACGGGNTTSAPAAASSAASSVEEAAAEASTAAAEASTEEAAEASTEETAETDGDAVSEAAMNYFAAFPKMADYANNNIKTEDLLPKIDAEEDMVILDIRSADDYAAGHLKGAINAPYKDIPSFLDQIPDDKPVFVNCYSGQTSSQTVALLNIAGKYAVNIVSGWNGGISQTEGYEEYVETDENTFDGADYPVDDDMKAAITDYYATATSDTYASFNFPPADLKELVDAESDAYTILSVRQANDYDEGHIAGAINIPFGQDMQNSFSEIPTDKPVIVYCYSGQTASQVMAVLRMLGYEAYNLAGGMGASGKSGWLKDDYPVVTD